MSTLEKAIEIAKKAHEGQKDKEGKDYILHPLRVMRCGKTEIEKICGVLHDVVEDSNWTFEKLEAEGFSKEIIEVLRCVTKTKRSENYDDFISRIIQNPIAVNVKINDILDNIDVTRLRKFSIYNFHQTRKYLKAYRRLTVAKIQYKKLPRHYYKISNIFVVKDPYIGFWKWTPDKQAWRKYSELSEPHEHTDEISQQEVEIYYIKALKLLDDEVLDYLAREKFF